MGKVIATIVLVVIIIVLIFVMVWGMGLLKFLPESMQVENAIGNWATSCNGISISWDGALLPEDAQQGLEFEQPIENVKSIMLHFSHEDIEVVQTDDSVVRIEQTSEQKLEGDAVMRYGMLNGKMVAQSGVMGKLVHTMTPASKITLFVPRGITVDINLDTTSGDITVGDGSYANLSMDSTSGKVNVGQVSAAIVDMDTTSGSVTVELANCNEINVSVVSGTVEVNADATKEVDISSTSGSITFTGQTHIFDADTVSGTVYTEIAGLGEYSVDTTSGSVDLLCEDTEQLRSIDVDTISGTTTIHLPENDGFEVDFDSVSGSLQNEFEVVGDKHKNGEIDISVDSTSGALRILKK